MKKLLVFLLAAHVLKELVWAGLIPIWHFPDEEQHFAHVAFYAEKSFFPEGTGIKEDVSREIDKSSEILGTKRNDQGVNKFTYHPEYRIPYTKSEIGLFEQDIRDLNTRENRQEMVKRGAARYGPVFYVFSSWFYKLFYKSDLFSRVFSTRLASIILSTLTVLVIFLIGKKIFKDKLSQIALAVLVSFLPMFSFVSAGVNSDNLFNLIFSLILLFCIKLFFESEKLIDKKNILLSIGLVISLGIGLYTKEQIYIAIPVIAFAFLLSLILGKKKERGKEILFFLLAGIVFYFLFGKRGIPEYNPLAGNKLNESFFQYIFWHLKHTIAETIPWYWGVFNWLGVTLPSWVNKIQARILIASFLGFIVFIIKQLRKSKFLSKKNVKIIFLLGSAFIYYFAIIVWDYFFRRGHSFSFGLQGRYFFPTISAHMIFIILGLKNLLPQKFKHYQYYLLKVLVVWWFVFSIIGIRTAVDSYYQLGPVFTFLNQASQYKPMFLKGWRMAVLILLGFAGSLGFIARVIFINEKNNR